jgi:two-component system chemotaxis sensor kinase CheA
VSEIDPAILEVFREEASERLDRMVEDLIALEEGRSGKEAVDSLFREAHSIKGSAGMVGLEEAAAIAHAIEDVLGTARAADEVPTQLADPLLRATDALRLAVAGKVGVSADVLAALTAAERQHASSETPADEDRAGAPPAKEPVSAPAAKEPPVAVSGEPAEAPPSGEAKRLPERRSIRASADKIDRLLDTVSETVLHHRRVEHLLANGGRGLGHDDERIDEELGRGELLVEDLQDAVLQMRTLPLSAITRPMRRAVRDLAVAHGIDAALEVNGADTPLDRMMLDGLSDAITHLLRNAVAHGVEPPDERERAGKAPAGRIAIRAVQHGSMVEIAVSDDGRGVPRELLHESTESAGLFEVLAQAGVSTAKEVSDVAGRGVGLDAVKARIESLGGDVEMRSEAGVGTTVTLRIPFTLALMRVLLLQRGGQLFGVPLTSVEEVVTVTETVTLAGRAAIELRNRSIPLCDLSDIIGAGAPALWQPPKALIVTSSGRRLAVACDRIVEEQEVVTKSLGILLAGVPGYLGAAILGDGGIALILDPAFLTQAPRSRAPARLRAEPVPSKVLVVDDQFTVRELQRSILEAAGYRVETARDGSEALSRIGAEPDVGLVVTDIEMPEMDGIELLRSIRSEPKNAALPIVMVTARGSEEDRRRGVEEGADAYLIKSEFNQQALLDTVERLLAR